MNEWIKIITSLMIVILIALLILIFLNYINNREIINIINSNNSNTTNTSGDNNKETEKIIIEEKNIDSGSKEKEISGENIVDIPNKEDEHTPKPEKKPGKRPFIEEKPKDTNPIITSNVDTSNEEKRQVLSELDSALQGLLDVVSKVPTVDEEKLDASLKESEVSP